ncbi:hypothetical protein [Shinella sp.]|uniref:hypothetical protein n=1 Tax=Shinella sp. TaxID=1870904 RepID=UPI003F72575C
MAKPTADVIKDGDQWVVVLIEDGTEIRKEFDIQQHALNWLEGQRMRLGWKNAEAYPDVSVEPSGGAGRKDAADE